MNSSVTPAGVRAPSISSAMTDRAASVLLASRALKKARSGVEVIARHREPGSHGMAAALLEVPFGHRRAHRRADIDARDRAQGARALVLASQAMTQAGRWKRSTSRLATSPTTPLCQLIGGDHQQRQTGIGLDQVIGMRHRLLEHPRLDRPCARD